MINIELHLRNLMASVAVSAFALSAAPAYADDKKPEKPIVAKKQDEEEKKDEEKNGENGEEKSEDKDGKDKKKKKKLIKDIVEDHETIDGLFKLYRDPKSGSLHMEVRADQLDKEFIYFSHTADGVLDGGHFRGQYRTQKVLTFQKHYDKIEIVEQNPYFYFDPENEISKAGDANISAATLFTTKVKASTEDENTYLINVDGLFKSEALDQVKPSAVPNRKPWESFSLGKLSRGKTRISTVKNFPENTFVTVDYVYSNPAPMNRGANFGITDARNVKVSIQHSFLEMPQNDFKPRFDDARVGYFLDYVNDMTDRSATPWRDMINRWHLVKKNPEAALSEPVEPIVWWIENTTPEELRPIIKKAGETWNIAFEAAGFKNAVQVKTQPDDADWDADDIRYNVLRWTSSPRPPFGGYGPSFTNPRTGQILGADIMLEYSFLTNRINAGNIFDKALLETASEENEALMSQMRKHEQNCSMANHLQLNNMLGKTLNAAIDGTETASKQLVEESIYYLILHEIGHTLGLNHNMKATQSRSYDTAHDMSAQEAGLVSSVMDYPSINFAPQGETQAHYYTTKPGAYDIWAIQFGYDPSLDDEVKREAHLARSNEKLLTFGNDADDMRSPGKGIDPRVNIYDMSDDAVQFAEDRLKLDHAAMSKLKEKFTKEGQSYQELRNAYIILTTDMAWQGRVVSRYIGGVYVDRSTAGQDGAQAPYRPVEKAKQKQAMQLLRDYILSPNAFEADPELIQHLAIQRRGFFHFTGTEDPKMHSRVSVIQADILSHILHPRTLLRITDSSLYGNEYSITEMMQDLTDAVFEDDNRSAVNSYRQELQIMYVNGLVGILSGENYDYIARSHALANLRDIRKNMDRWRGDAAARVHRQHIAFLIDKALEVYKG